MDTHPKNKQQQKGIRMLCLSSALVWSAIGWLLGMHIFTLGYGGFAALLFGLGALPIVIGVMAPKHAYVFSVAHNLGMLGGTLFKGSIWAINHHYYLSSYLCDSGPLVAFGIIAVVSGALTSVIGRVARQSISRNS